MTLRSLTPVAREKWTKEFRTLRSNLSEWQTPLAFNGRVAKVLKQVPNYVMFSLPAAQVARDAWIVGTYADLAHADEVRLPSDEWPDGLVRFGARAINIEATEIQEPGRRRGDEYRATKGGV